MLFPAIDPNAPSTAEIDEQQKVSDRD